MFRKKIVERFDVNGDTFEEYLCAIGTSINRINRQMEEVN